MCRFVARAPPAIHVRHLQGVRWQMWKCGKVWIVKRICAVSRSVCNELTSLLVCHLQHAAAAWQRGVHPQAMLAQKHCASQDGGHGNCLLPSGGDDEQKMRARACCSSSATSEKQGESATSEIARQRNEQRAPSAAALPRLRSCGRAA